MRLLERCRVLYVDDDEGLLNIGKLYMERDPEFTVITASSSEEGLKILSTERIDLIISDNDMPGTTGIEFLKKVRSVPMLEGIPFIIFTGRSREEIVIDAINNGVDFYLQKGTDPKPQYAELLSMAMTAYNKRRYDRIIRKVYDFTVKVVEGEALETSVETILDGIIEILHADVSHVSIIEKGYLRNFASCGDVNEELKASKIPIDNGLGGLVIQEKRARSVIDYREEEEIKRPDNDMGLKDNIISGAAAPIMFGDRVLGVLYVYRRFSKRFSPKDLRTLSLYANIIAMALNRAPEWQYEE